MKHISSTSLVIAFLILFSPAFSQSHTTGFAVNPKLGIFVWPNNKNGAALGVETNYLRNGWMLSVDFFQFQEIQLLSSDEDIFRQVGIMAGKYYGDRLFRIQLQGGVASIWEIGYGGSSEPENFSTVGLVLKTGFKFIPLRFFSIGLDLQSNLNPQKPLFMPLISIEFGTLRDNINQQ
ncbi:MAG TPA: hypothetical protein VK861_03380 [Bacteroidales bacterium]|nr:hypothetical protein [Bacteroidales bacterium]